MINSRMWLVVTPTVGLPLFLGAVAVGSFSEHVAITTNTTWVNDFLSGREMGSTDAKMVMIHHDVLNRCSAQKGAVSTSLHMTL